MKTKTKRMAFLLIFVLITTLFLSVSLQAFAANDYQTSLSVQTAGSSIETAQSYEQDYTFGFKLDNLAVGDASDIVATIDFGVGTGNHYLRLVIYGRDVYAYVFTQGDASEGGVAVDVPDGWTGKDMVVAEGWPHLWVRGGTEAKINFSADLAEKTLSVSAGFSSKDYNALTNMYRIDLSDKFTDNSWFDPAETLKGKVRILPNFQTGDKFEIKEINSNGTLLDLNSDVVLSNNKHFKKNFLLPGFTVDGTQTQKKVSPFEISSVGFGDEDVVFKVDLRLDRLAMGETVWQSDIKFGLMFGMDSEDDTFASENVLSLYFDIMAAINIKQGENVTALGNSSAVLRGNDVVPWLKVEVTGYGNGNLHVKYFLSYGHDNQTVYEDTFDDFEFDGKMAVFADWTTYVEGDGVKFYDTAIIVNTIQNPEQITLDSTEFALKEGATKTLVATVLPEDASDKSVTWSSSDESVATVDQNGVVTAVGYGTATITAQTIIPDVKATAAVNVIKAVTGVTLNKTSVTLYKNETETLTATVEPAGQTADGVVWTSSDENVATVDQNGVVTAVANGTATIMATSADDITKSAACTVTVRTHVTSVVLDKNQHSFTNPGQNLTLVATVYPVNASDKSLNWSSSNTEVATVENGVVTAIGNGTATITVKTTDGNFEDTCTVTVTTAVTGVTLNEEEISIKVGSDTFTLIANIAPTTASNKGITWTSSDESVATVDENGVVTAVANGTATITATTADGSFTATCEVTVTTDVEGISISKTSTTIEAGKTETLTVTFNPATASNKGVTWTSSDESIATVDQNGVVTAKAKGTVTITAKSADGNFEATCTVTVTKKGGCFSEMGGYAIFAGAILIALLLASGIIRKNNASTK